MPILPLFIAHMANPLSPFNAPQLSILSFHSLLNFSSLLSSYKLMGRKLFFSSLSSSSSSPCIWPSCTKPKTNSFRLITSPLLNTPSTLEPSTDQASEVLIPNISAEKTVAEAVTDALRSDRLFYDPCGGETSAVTAGFDVGVAVAVESADPYGDFRASMGEMVEAHGGAREWEWMQEMLVWFLRANGKGNHGLIVGAFLDLIVGFGPSSTSFSSCHDDDKNHLSSSCSSNSSSSCVFEVDKVGVERKGNG